ncbi:MAG: sensor histidine kinase [Actinomycetota bacterium]
MRPRSSDETQPAPGGLPRRASFTRSAVVLLATLAALVVVLTVWTVLIPSTPFLTFVIEWRRTRLSPESIGLVVSTVAAILVYLRYTVSGSTRLLYVALAFVVLALAQLLVGISIGQSAGFVPRRDIYLWTAGRMLSAGLFLAGAVTRPTETRPARGSTGTFLRATLAVVALLAAVEAAIWSLGPRLPLLTTATGDQVLHSHGILPGLTPADLAMGAAGAALYLLAAILYLRPFKAPPPESRWLAPGLTIAAASHLHYMLSPVILPDRLGTGDLLRLVFAGVLLGGVSWEIRRSIVSEQDRAAELESAYADEQLRVRELEDAERHKAEMFSVLTHELAHPVSSLRGFVLTLSSRWRKLDDATRDRALQRMDHESKRLRDLAEEVVSVAQLDRAGFSVVCRPEPVRDLVREALGAVSGMEGHVDVQVDEGAAGVVVSIDRARILQVFRNLISNAIKYSPAGSPVRMRVHLDPPEVVIEVDDDGPGIPEEDLPRLFHQFTRLRRPADETVGGSGLGLYISRRIIEAHNGRIWVESEPGRGSTFAFALPVLDGAGDS